MAEADGAGRWQILVENFTAAGFPARIANRTSFATDRLVALKFLPPVRKEGVNVITAR
jgi:hypothetical protein